MAGRYAQEVQDLEEEVKVWRENAHEANERAKRVDDTLTEFYQENQRLKAEVAELSANVESLLQRLELVDKQSVDGQEV